MMQILKSLKDEDEVSGVQTVRPETQIVKTRDDKSGQTFKKQGISFRKLKACFVCKSTDHLIKNCNFHDKKSQESNLKNVVNTSQREGKPVWDNTKRVNHQNFSKYPHLSKTFVPSGVLTRIGFVSTARPSINTARPVCTARPSINTARPVYASRPIYLRMDNVRPRGLCSPIKRSYYTKPAFRTKDLKQEVNIFGVKNMTTDGKKAVVNTGKGQSRDLTMKITIEALWLLEGIPKAVLTLVKMVKIMEKALKRKTHKVVISESEGEEPEDHGRIIQDIDDDPLVFLVRESMKMKEKSTDFFTPTKDSGEAQEEEISPTILEAANTLSKVASHGGSKVKSTDKGKRYRRKARSLAKNINIGLDVEEEINIGIKDVNTGSTKVDSGTASKRGQRKGKNPVVEEDIQATHKTKEQIRQEEAGLEEAIKEEALSEQQKKKKAKVQFEAQFYTEEDWDAIRAKLEANAELTKDVLGKDLHEQDFAKRMVEMNQGTWKLSQLKKLKFEEIKEEFDKLVQQIDTFVPINHEATKEKLKRYGEEL
ncbi:hypothetical protein Tco_1062995 [Tanacetum coccineum]